MRELGLAIQTMFADLEQRCLDAEFDAAFPTTGSFSKKERKGRGYWYFQDYEDGHRHSRYVGPAEDPEIAARVERFRDLKADFTERRRMVSALKAAGLPSLDAFTGDLAEALWQAGVFRLPDSQWEMPANAIRRAGGSQKRKPDDVGFGKGGEPCVTQEDGGP